MKVASLTNTSLKQVYAYWLWNIINCDCLTNVSVAKYVRSDQIISNVYEMLILYFSQKLAKY